MFASFGASASTASAQTATVSLSPASIPANGVSTSTVTVTVTGASPGSVMLVAGDSGITFSPNPALNNGNNTFTSTLTSSLTPEVTPIFAYGTGVPPVAPAYLTQTAPTTISLTAVANSSPPVTNQGVTLVATVSSATPSVSPSGTMTFEGDGAPIAGCTNVPTPQMSSAALTVPCGTAFAAALSPIRLTAVFTPDANTLAAPSTSVAESLSVGRDTTSTAVTFTGSKAEVNAPVRFDAIVTPTQPGPFAPGGAVEFSDHGKPIAGCRSRPVGSGATASCIVTYATVGDHVITARYLGSPSFAGSASRGAPVAVQALGTVNAHMEWTFYYTPTYTEVLAMTVQSAPPDAKILVNCRGRGCPFLRRTISTGKVIRCGRGRLCASHGTIDLAPRFGRRHLAVGARISVEIVKPGWIGKYYTFTVIARHGPRIGIT